MKLHKVVLAVADRASVFEARMWRPMYSIQLVGGGGSGAQGGEGGRGGALHNAGVPSEQTVMEGGRGSALYNAGVPSGQIVMERGRGSALYKAGVPSEQIVMERGRGSALYKAGVPGEQTVMGGSGRRGGGGHRPDLVLPERAIAVQAYGSRPVPAP
jgi:hypothetical protein